MTMNAIIERETGDYEPQYVKIFILMWCGVVVCSGGWCGGVGVVVLVWWCWCGGVGVVVLVWCDIDVVLLGWR